MQERVDLSVVVHDIQTHKPGLQSNGEAGDGSGAEQLRSLEQRLLQKY